MLVSQLQGELSSRGLSNSGLKGALVARLEDAIRDEAAVAAEEAIRSAQVYKQALKDGLSGPSSSAASGGGQQATMTDFFSTKVEPEQALTSEYILGLKVAELKAELKDRGQTTTGLKKVLQERLLGVASVAASSADSTVKEEGGGKRQKIVRGGKAKAKVKVSRSRPSKPDAVLQRIGRNCDVVELNAYLVSLNDEERARELSFAATWHEEDYGDWGAYV